MARGDLPSVVLHCAAAPAAEPTRWAARWHGSTSGLRRRSASPPRSVRWGRPRPQRALRRVCGL